jgi:glycerol dehydrogenase-like iron-containing ADH family enzyme
MNLKQILVAGLLATTGSANALTLEQSRGMVYAECAGAYMAAASVAFDQNRTTDYERSSRLLDLASEQASIRIGDGRTTDIAEATVSRLLNEYRKNPLVAIDTIATECSACSEYFR